MSTSPGFSARPARPAYYPGSEARYARAVSGAPTVRRLGPEAPDSLPPTLLEGFDPDGTYCIRFTAPPETRNLYAARTRLCLNLGLGVPVKIDVFDRQGLLELFRYEDVRIRQPEDADLFTAGAGTP